MDKYREAAKTLLELLEKGEDLIGQLNEPENGGGYVNSKKINNIWFDFQTIENIDKRVEDMIKKLEENK